MRRHPAAVPEFRVARRADLVARGIDRNRVRRRVAAGRWQEPVPGVVVGHSGALTLRERREVAIAWGGGSARLSHTSALHLHRARVELPRSAGRVAGVRGDYVTPEDGGLEQITVPHGRHLASRAFVVVHQSRRPTGDLVVDGLPVTTAARAVVDVALSARTRRDVEHVVADALQRDLTTVGQLAEEVVLLGRLATPWLRDTLRDAARGMRSVGESDLRRVVVAEGLPEPEWGAAVSTPRGTYHVDARWRAQRVVAEADGAAFHLGSAEWQADLVRQNAIVSTGDRLLRFPVARLRRDRQTCGQELRRALDL